MRRSPPISGESYPALDPLPEQTNPAVIYTEDVATKVTRGVRRRCFKCHTIDTSTWRRSDRNPGKVVSRL